jgi:hypothetical protein
MWVVKSSGGYYFSACTTKSGENVVTCGTGDKMSALRFPTREHAARIAAAWCGANGLTRPVRIVKARGCSRCGEPKITHDGGAGRRLCTWCGEREGAALLKRK